MKKKEFRELSDGEKRSFICQMLAKGINNQVSNTEEYSQFESFTKYPTIEPDPANRFVPFPLTDIQESFFVGRQIGARSDRIGCHIYQMRKVDGCGGITAYGKYCIPEPCRIGDRVVGICRHT